VPYNIEYVGGGLPVILVITNLTVIDIVVGLPNTTGVVGALDGEVFAIYV